jgi:hypothetical protein
MLHDLEQQSDHRQSRQSEIVHVSPALRRKDPGADDSKYPMEKGMAKTVDVVVLSRPVIAIGSNSRRGEGHHKYDFGLQNEVLATGRGDDRGARRTRYSLDDLLAWVLRR